jgi:hypothetical protein
MMRLGPEFDTGRAQIVEHGLTVQAVGQLTEVVSGLSLVTYNTRRPNKSDFMRGRTPRQVLDSHRHKRAA